MIGSIIGGAASIIGNLLGFGSNHQTNQANKELAKYQYDLAVDMWNKQNEYNSPKAQMERFREAGLNPNLIYGNGAASAGNAGSPPQYQAPNLRSYQGWDLNGAARLGVDILNAKQAREKMKADTQLAQHTSELTVANTLKSLVGIPGIISDNAIKAVNAAYQEELIQNEITRRQLQNEELSQNLTLIGKRIEFQDVQNELARYDLKYLRPAQVQQLAATTYNNLLQGDILKWQRDLRDIGIPPNSPWFVPFLVDIIGAENVEALIKQGNTFFTKLLKGEFEGPIERFKKSVTGQNEVGRKISDANRIGGLKGSISIR